MLVSIALSLLAQANTAPADVRSLELRAKKIIAARLIDPASLQLRNVRIKQAVVDGTSQTILCGEYNAKNRLGGYAGFKPFAYDPQTYKAVVTLTMGGPNGLEIGYYSEDGSGDFSTSDSPREMLRAGVSSEDYDAISDRVMKAAPQTVARCATS